MDEEDEDFIGEASDDYKRNNVRSFKYGLSGGVDNSINHPFHLTGLEANAKKPFPCTVPDHQYSAPLSQRELFGAKTLKPTVMGRRTEYLQNEDSMHPRGTLKVLVTLDLICN